MPVLFLKMQISYNPRTFGRKQKSLRWLEAPCAGRSQRTEIVRSQNNVNFDRMFVFSDIRLTADEFERQNIHVQVFNANVIFRNDEKPR